MSIFAADGNLIESWASLKSFVRKDSGDQKKVDSAKDDDPSIVIELLFGVFITPHKGGGFVPQQTQAF